MDRIVRIGVHQGHCDPLIVRTESSESMYIKEHWTQRLPIDVEGRILIVPDASGLVGNGENWIDPGKQNQNLFQQERNPWKPNTVFNVLFAKKGFGIGKRGSVSFDPFQPLPPPHLPRQPPALMSTVRCVSVNSQRMAQTGKLRSPQSSHCKVSV